MHHHTIHNVSSVSIGLRRFDRVVRIAEDALVTKSIDATVKAAYQSACLPVLNNPNSA